MTLRLETGCHVYGWRVTEVGNSARFVTEDGRVMFEIIPGKNGRSLEVRAVESAMVDGEIYSGLLDVRPNVANSITLMLRRYDDF